MHDADFEERTAPHAPSAHIAAGRVPWRGLKATLLALAVGLAAWFLHERGDETPRAQSQVPMAAAPSATERSAPPHASRTPSQPAASAARQPPAPSAKQSAATAGPSRGFEQQRLDPAPAEPHPEFRPLRFADFGHEVPTYEVQHVADWALDSGDHEGRSFVIIDKKDARAWLFDPTGHLVASTPALLGKAVGDDPVPGIGEKPLSQILPHEKTTPAGRFVAEPGVNTHGEDIVWVSYDLAVSMHRVRPTVKSERRLQRLASLTPADNRISFGCINLPVAFYEQLLSPAVRRTGAIVYVLPETRTPQEQFGSYEVAERPLFAVGPVRSALVK